MPVEQADTHRPVHAGGNALAFLDDLVPRRDGDAALADGIHALLHDGAVVRILAPLQGDGIFAGNAALLRAGGQYDAQVVAIDDLPAGPVGQLLDDVAVIAGLVVRQDGDVPLQNDEAHRIRGLALVVVGLLDLRLHEPAARLGGYGPGVLPVPFAAVQEGLPSPAGISGQRGIVGLVAVGPAGDAQAWLDGRLADLRHDERGLGVVVVCVALDPVPDPVVAGLGAGGDRLAPYDRVPGRGIADEVLQRAALGLAGLHQLLGLAVVDQRIRDHHAGRDPTDGHKQGLRLGVPVVFVAEHLVPDGVVARFGAGGDGRGILPGCPFRRAKGIFHRAVVGLARLDERLGAAVVDRLQGRGRDGGSVRLRDGRLNARRPEILVVIVAGNHVGYIVGSRLDTGGDGFAEPTRLAGVQHRTAGGHARDRHERLIRPVVGAVDCHDRCRYAFSLVDVYGERGCLGTALVVIVARRRGAHDHLVDPDGGARLDGQVHLLLVELKIKEVDVVGAAHLAVDGIRDLALPVFGLFQLRRLGFVAVNDRHGLLFDIGQRIGHPADRHGDMRVKRLIIVIFPDGYEHDHRAGLIAGGQNAVVVQGAALRICMEFKADLALRAVQRDVLHQVDGVPARHHPCGARDLRGVRGFPDGHGDRGFLGGALVVVVARRRGLHDHLIVPDRGAFGNHQRGAVQAEVVYIGSIDAIENAVYNISNCVIRQTAYHSFDNARYTAASAGDDGRSDAACKALYDAVFNAVQGALEDVLYEAARYLLLAFDCIGHQSNRICCRFQRCPLE